MAFRLLKKTILRKNKNFQNVYHQGRSFSNRMLVIYVLPCQDGVRRVGFAAGKRLGDAVVRNRVKRLLRETYRLNQYRLKTGYDLLLVGRRPLVDETYHAAAAAFIEVCRKARILDK